MKCYTACNNAFFPELSCQEIDNLEIEYQHNIYSTFYLFPRPNLLLTQSGLKDYETCKSYINDNPTYPLVKGEDPDIKR